MIAIPFEVEKAKKIQAGELPGKIVTRDGYNVRIVCWDRKDDTFPIVALIHFEEGNNEYCTCYKVNGYSLASESKYEKDLLLQVPEWTLFEDGDILATKTGNCFVLNANGEYKTSCYVGLFHDKISFGGAANENNIEAMTYANEEEIQQFIDALKASTAPRAKEYLKRFFGIEEKPECKFEPFQKVLVRMHDGSTWEASLFSHLTNKKHKPFMTVGGIEYEQCIPYNDQTKHLLGTTDNWEGEQ